MEESGGRNYEKLALTLFHFIFLKFFTPCLKSKLKKNSDQPPYKPLERKNKILFWQNRSIVR